MWAGSPYLTAAYDNLGTLVACNADVQTYQHPCLKIDPAASLPLVSFIDLDIGNDAMILQELPIPGENHFFTVGKQGPVVITEQVRNVTEGEDLADSDILYSQYVGGSLRNDHFCAAQALDEPDKVSIWVLIIFICCHQSPHQ